MNADRVGIAVIIRALDNRAVSHQELEYSSETPRHLWEEVFYLFISQHSWLANCTWYQETLDKSVSRLQWLYININLRRGIEEMKRAAGFKFTDEYIANSHFYPIRSWGLLQVADKDFVWFFGTDSVLSCLIATAPSSVCQSPQSIVRDFESPPLFRIPFSGSDDPIS